ILMDSTTVREALINNFKGVRIDGSNATIIGDRLGEFKSDRNNISRVWMDHGAWPLLTTQLYIDKTGDIDLLFEIVSYFEDQFTHYTKQTRKEWTPTHYAGTILEHLLVENIIPFFNVGEHNNLRLEDADWNDGLDMAKERGESVAFTAFYGNNLVKLGKILMTLYKKGYHTVKLLEQLNTLLKTIDYNNISLKQKMLDTYFDAINTKKLNTQPYECLALSKKLTELGTYLLQQVRENEWLEKEEDGWFNGYYDNNGNRLDNVIDKDMTLTPQVFTIMSSAATDKQVEKIIASADRYLFDITVGGYRLNTPFNEIKTNMGRLFGFGYGHKENGAMFTHMAMMYAYALYHRGYVKEGHKVFTTIYEYVSDIEKAKIYPGLPEYVDPMGRGMYTYLTGSASWYLLTLVTQVFGIQGQWGNILLNPKLVKSDFHHTKASIKTMVNNRSITFEYINTEDLDYEDYIITKVMADNQSIPFEESTEGVIINGQLTVDKLIIYLNRKA
ncbi:MAG: cellobiose phosphorylase, partial [Candidatus Izimaplasma sp.]|nr:cellobiose phosphorylase [Candidatus Izimaplasma bacterium]